MAEAHPYALERPLGGPAHAIMVEVLVHGPLARSEIARRLDLSAATLTRLTKPLLDAGLLVEAGPTTRVGVGRPTQPLDVDAGSLHFVGVKVTADEVHGVLTDLRAHVEASMIVPLEGHAPHEVVEAVAAVAGALATRTARVTALGVSAGGLVDDNATLKAAAYLGWGDGVPLADLLRAKTGLPTVVANDVEAWTQAERWFGDGRDAESFALVTTGVGVGYSFIASGQLTTSPDVGVGSAAHIVLDPLGPLCHEGHRGCAEAMLTSGAICAGVGIGLERRVEYDEALALARQGDPVARTVVEASARAYGRLLALIANLTFVPLIIVSGEGVGLALEWEEVVRDEFREGRHPMASNVRLLIKRAPFTEWARGAAVVAIQTCVLGR